MDQKILDKLTKIKALVERGEQGERKAAEQALTNLLTKYNITIEDLESEVQKNHSFHVKPSEWFVFSQLRFQMFYKRSLYSSQKKHWYIMEMTEAEFIEFSAMFDFHKSQYEKELLKITDTLKSAYANKHDMFWRGEVDEPKGKSKTSLEDIRNAEMMMGMLEDASFRKALA